MSILERLARNDERGGSRGRHSILLAAIVMLLVLLPVFKFIPRGALRFSMLFYLVLSAAVYVTSTERWMFLVAACVGAGADCRHCSQVTRR